jgi:tetratricopeptide (TPR) repeat protein
LHNRGIGHMKKGELDAALADLNESIRLNPNDLWARSTRANVHRLKGAYDRALSELNEILRRDPNSIGAYVDRGMVHLDRGDLQSARSDFQAVLGLKDKNPDLERWAKKEARQRLEELAKR